ncbi:hypothetical protein AMS68_000429 [Peltaster fructicola]|uniref:Uncharacterized protein n=1 Tax=Peltaster fructicola TaxID=286661 RepID=A0A6H0XJL9_9PEZI|nr:hypothetical protein AMS68_000429 [Peltaster fructicola]
MSTLIIRTRANVLRLQQAVERNGLRRYAQQVRHESSTPKNTRNVSTVAEQKTWAAVLYSQPWFAPVMVPVRAYDRAHRRRPLLVQLLSSLAIYFLGDLSAQAIATSNFEEGSYEVERSLRSMTIGGIIAIPGYKWFVYLAQNFNYSSKLLSLGIKIGINQLFFTPIFSSYFFAMQSLLSGASLQDAWTRVKDTVPVSWMQSWKVWPAVMAFNFTYVPLQFRSIFAGFIAIGWQSYLSWLNKQAEAKERKSAALAVTE